MLHVTEAYLHRDELSVLAAMLRFDHGRARSSEQIEGLGPGRLCGGHGEVPKLHCQQFFAGVTELPRDGAVGIDNRARYRIDHVDEIVGSIQEAPEGSNLVLGALMLGSNPKRLDPKGQIATELV